MSGKTKNNPLNTGRRIKRRRKIKMDIVAMILMIIGALNWGLIGICQFDVVAMLCGGMAGIVSRIIYTLVGLAGIWGIIMLCRRGGLDNKKRD